MATILCSCSLFHGVSTYYPDEYMDADQYVSDGYTTRSKKDDTSSIQRVVTDDYISSYSDIISYLEGRVAGLSVIGGRVYLRGFDTEPLFVVDGVEMRDPTMVNPNDVATVDVLKGPEASIYGVKGMNGVIVITTKRGNEPTDSERRKKKFNVEVNSSFGFGKRH